jgi:hypothetical protein
LQSGLLRAGSIRRLLHARRRTDLSLTVWRARRLRLIWPRLIGLLLPLQAGLACGIIGLVVTQIIPVWIGLPQRALLADNLAADILRGMNLAHDALIAQRLLR